MLQPGTALTEIRQQHELAIPTRRVRVRVGSRRWSEFDGALMSVLGGGGFVHVDVLIGVEDADLAGDNEFGVWWEEGNVEARERVVSEDMVSLLENLSFKSMFIGFGSIISRVQCLK